MAKRAGWLALLLVGVLSACASPNHAAHDGETAPHAEGEECTEHDGCVTLVCGEELCGLYRCEDAGVLLARGGGFRPPVAAAAPGSGPRRNWGGPQGLPGDTEPVFVIRWYNHPAPEPVVTRVPSGPGWVRHHLFPQQQSMKEWFARGPRNINVHDFTMVIHESTHGRIHRGARGGEWNEAWREFIRLNSRASQQDCYEHLGKLIQRFNLMGPIVPYNYLR